VRGRDTIRSPAAAVAWAVVAFLIVLGATIGAGELLTLVERPDGSTGFDRSITHWMVEHRGDALTSLAKLLSAVGSQKVLIPLTALAVLLLLGRRRWIPALVLVVVWGGAILLYSVAKAVVGRPRPPEQIWLTHAGSTAFPSGHALQSLATYAGLVAIALYAYRRWRTPGLIAATALAAGVGWSRVYLGVHWTTDVLGGWLAAAAWLALILWLPIYAGPWRARGIGSEAMIVSESFVVADWTDPGTHPGRPIAGLHLHRVDDEAWYVLSGTLGFRIGDEERLVGAGESILVERGTPHSYWNPNPEPAHYLLVMTPRIHALIEALHSGERTDYAQIFEEHASELLS
jgi:undecaprenyl-diphosphatase